MSIDAGDAVVCVDATTPPRNRGFPPINTLLRKGRVYRVDRAVVSRIDNDTVIVKIDGISPWLFEHWRFRKIDLADAKFTRQMRALKPRVRETELV